MNIHESEHNTLVNVLKTKLRISAALVLIISLYQGMVSAQKTDLGSWWMYSGYNRIHDKWSVFTEVQYRSYNIGKDILQLLLRTGLNYHITEKSSVALGYTFLSTYKIESDITSPFAEEHAIWQQFMHRYALPNLVFEHRFRAEQRFINDLRNNNGDLYKNRFRYRLALAIPFGKENLEPNTFFASVMDEIFVQTEGYWLDQNRIFGGIGYKFSASANFQFGIMNQTFRYNDKWYLIFALGWNPDLRKTK